MVNIPSMKNTGEKFVTFLIILEQIRHTCNFYLNSSVDYLIYIVFIFQYFAPTGYLLFLFSYYS